MANTVASDDKCGDSDPDNGVVLGPKSCARAFAPRTRTRTGIDEGAALGQRACALALDVLCHDFTVV
jgi:hypothetical protein